MLLECFSFQKQENQTLSNCMKLDSVSYQEKKRMPSFHLSKISTVSFHVVRKRCKPEENSIFSTPNYPFVGLEQRLVVLLWLAYRFLETNEYKRLVERNGRPAVRKCYFLKMILLLVSKAANEVVARFAKIRHTKTRKLIRRENECIVLSEKKDACFYY